MSTAIVAIAVTVLASCAQGTSRDADRGRERDAERTSIVNSLQATESARLVSGTPEATPPSTPDE